MRIHTCKWCKGTGDWSKKQDDPDSCEICGGDGTVMVPFDYDYKPKNILSESDLNELAEFWSQSRRAATLGDFIQFVAMRTLEKYRWHDNATSNQEIDVNMTPKDIFAANTENLHQLADRLKRTEYDDLDACRAGDTILSLLKTNDQLREELLRRDVMRS